MSFACNVRSINSVHQWIFRCRMNIASKLSPFFCYDEHVGGSQVVDSRDVIPGAMSNWWTVYVEVFCSRWSIFHQNSFDCWRSKMFWLQLLQLKRFHHPFIIFLIGNLINEEMMSRLHQFWWTLLHLNFSLSSVFCVVIDSIIAWTPTYCMALCQHCLVD